MADERINLHHLHYFWAVAHEGSLTRSAQRLRVSQSAMSSQIRLLEGSLGEALFDRVGRGLALTEAGRVALAYADEIFATGDDLRATFAQGRARGQTLRVGAVATLSRNFQESFLAPLLGRPDLRLSLRAGSLDELVSQLAAHALDLVLSNRPPRRGADRALRCRRLARQAVSVVGGRRRRRRFAFPDDLRGRRLIVPGPESDVRTEFDALCEQLGVPVHIAVEVDDMAMLRLLARDTDALALVPTVVVRDELQSRALYELCVVPGLFESFYAVTVQRHFQHPLLRELLGRDEDALLARGAPKGAGA
jgi:LysR family transcriptional activator of nhaA